MYEQSIVNEGIREAKRKSASAAAAAAGAKAGAQERRKEGRGRWRGEWQQHVMLTRFSRVIGETQDWVSMCVCVCASAEGAGLQQRFSVGEEEQESRGGKRGKALEGET